MIVKLKPLHDGLTVPVRRTRGSFGYDLALAQDLIIQQHHTVIAPTGWQLAEDLPRGIRSTSGAPVDAAMAMLLLPRSSTFLKYGLIVANSPGLIDADYSGEIGMILHRLPKVDDKGYREIDYKTVIPAGTSIAQLVFVMTLFPSIEVVTEVNESRQRGGYGSTGA